MNIFDRKLQQQKRAEIELTVLAEFHEQRQRRLDELNQEIEQDPELEKYFGKHRDDVAAGVAADAEKLAELKRKLGQK